MLNEALSKMTEVFDPRILLQGLDYFQKGLVLNIRLSDGLFKGRVKGSTGHIYDIHMDLKSWPSKPAHCSCTAHSNCKHVVACLFALRDREKNVLESLPTHKLDRKLDTWLKNLQAQTKTVIKAHEATHHLVYLLTLKCSGHEHKVMVQLALAKILKKGGYGKKILFNSLPESKKQHFIDDDDEIVAQLLYKQGAFNWFHSFAIRNSELLQKIIASGRAFFSDDEEFPIHLGEPLNGYCEWKLTVNGEQSLKLMHDNRILQPLLLDDSWYFDTFELIMGPLKTLYPVRQLKYLLEAPPIPLDQVDLFTAKMMAICPDLPKPIVFDHKEVNEMQPIPVLILDVISSDDIFIAKVAFEYAEIMIPYNDDQSKILSQKEGVLIEYPRDLSYEEAKLAELQSTLELRNPSKTECEAWNSESPDFFVISQVFQSDDLGFLYSQVLPLLKSKGWRVQFASSLYQEVINADDLEWFSEIQERTNDFFSYQLGILVEGQPVSIVPLVSELIHQYRGNDLDAIDDETLIRLPLNDRRMLQLPMGRIKPLVRLLLQLGPQSVDDHQHVHMSKYQLVLMQETELALAATQARWQGAELIRLQLMQLVNQGQLPDVEVPQGLQTTLREYQQQGLNWLQYLRGIRFNGILADDMGLGKTVQTLAHLQYEKEQGRLAHATLIIAPTSLVGNWLAEAKRFTPELSVMVYHGSDRHQDDFDDYDLVISTYGLIHRDKDTFVNYQFYYLILDEAQFIKNARTKTTQIIQQLKAHHRLCLTGTPMENHLGELWSLFYFLMPGLLGDVKQFRRWFRTPIEKYGDLDRRELLAKRVKPFMLRRTKNQVAKELPPKTEMTRTIELQGVQRDLYETIRMSMEKKVRDAIAKQGLGKSHIVLLDALLKLRQVCCDPRLLSLPEASIAHGMSSKLDALMELLDNLVEEGRRVLVFSQFTSMLKLIEEQLHIKNYPYLKLTGQTQNRQQLVEQFQQGNVPIFLISLKAGGTGLNLTRADTVILYDPWWNPAVEDQATDRTHRIGQEQPVFVYKLITQGTVEEAIMGMQERKRQLAEGILSSDASGGLSLREEDLEQFFMPLE